MKKTVSFLLILCMMMSCMTFVANAQYDNSLATKGYFYDDFSKFEPFTNSNYPTATQRPYLASFPDLKTENTHWGLMDVDNDGVENNSLYLQSENGSTPAYYLNGIGGPYTGTFKISLDLYPFDNATVREFSIRYDSTVKPILKLNTSGQIKWLNNGTEILVGTYDANKWMNLTIYFDTDSKSCSVCIDEEYKGTYALEALINLRAIKLLQGYNDPALAAEGVTRNNKIAIDNAYIGYTSNQTYSLNSSNVADGAVDVDVDKTFKFYGSAEFDSLKAAVVNLNDYSVSELSTSVVGNTAKGNLETKLDANTNYALVIVGSYKDTDELFNQVINFTTGSGAARTNALNINFEGIGTTANDIKAAYGDGSIALSEANSADKDVSTYFSVADSNGVNGKVLKIDPEDNLNKINYDFNAILPYAVKENTVVIEFDRYDTSSETRGPSKILNATGDVTKFLTEHATSDIKAFKDGSSSSIYVRPVRPKDNVFNEYKFVINYDAATTNYTYTFYINGVLQGLNNAYAQDVNIGSMENIGRLTLQLWGRTSFAATDCLQLDNIRISYNTPVVSAKVGENDITEISSLNVGETLTASVTGTSVFETAPMLIMAVYKDELLDYIDFTETIEWTVPEDINTSDYKIVVMLWDGFENIIPLTDALVID